MENSNETQELTKEQCAEQAEAQRKEDAKPMTMGQVMKLPVTGGQRVEKHLNRSQLVQRYDGAIAELQHIQNGMQKTIQGMLQNLQRNVFVIKQLSEKLEESQFTISAFHNLFMAKKIFKEEELRTEVIRVVEVEEKRRELELDKRAGLSDKGPEAVVETGDVVIMSYEGTLYGATKPFEHGGVADKVAFPIGQGLMGEDFDKQLIGHRIGDIGVLDMQFPDNFRADLAKQKAQFKVTIHNIKVPIKVTDPADKLPEPSKA